MCGLLGAEAIGLQLKPKSLFQRIQPSTQAGFIPSSGVLVEHALLDGLIESRNRLAENLLGGGLITLCKGLAEVAQGGAKTRVVAAITLCAGFSLPGAFQRRKMICHCVMMPLL